MKEVSVQEAKRLVEEEGYRYLDVRTAEEFAAGHPAGAVCVPVVFRTPQGPQPNPDFLSVVEKHFPKDAKLVVGCQAGGRSAKACKILASAGYGNVVNVAGGFGGARGISGEVVATGWKEAGLPVEEGGEVLS